MPARPGAGGARIVFDSARTRPRGRASDLGRGAAARSRVGRGSRPAQPRRGILNRIPRFLEPCWNDIELRSKRAGGVGPAAPGRRAARWRPAAAAASRIATSSATRFIAFGDETSLHRRHDGNFNGRKYSVNGRSSATDPTVDCRNNPIWIQSLRWPSATSCSRRATRPPRRCSTRRTGSARRSVRAPPTSRRRSTPSWPKARLPRRRHGDGAGRRQRRAAAVRAVPGLSEVQLTANVEAAGREVAVR